MNDCHQSCPCWATGSQVGHEGHCCFLRDRRSKPPVEADWRTDEDACLPPRSTEDPDTFEEFA